MQAIAAWLLARPHHAVTGLAVTALLPVPQIFSGAVMVLLVLVQGTRVAVTEAAAAAAILFAITALFGGALASMFVLLATAWIPAVLLVVLLLAMRSLTLTLQLSVILAVVAILVFQLVVPDPTAFWQPYLDLMGRVFEENGLQLDAELELLSADAMTVSAVLALWTVYTVALLIGYWLYRRLPFDTRDFGQFRDLDFGRVIAFATTLTIVLMFVVEWTWLQNIASVMFAMFTMHGLAIVHWLRAKNIWPRFALVAAYILLPFLHVLLALIGIMDVWLGFRRRLTKA